MATGSVCPEIEMEMESWQLQSLFSNSTNSSSSSSSGRSRNRNRKKSGVRSNCHAGWRTFLSKTYDMVEEASTNHLISWSNNNNSNSFVVWDPHLFARDLLPRVFRHNNFASFLRQLSTYGFRKVDPERWEFQVDGFVRGQRHLLASITRRRRPSSSPSTLYKSTQICLEDRIAEVEDQIELLRRNKTLMLLESMRLRQKQNEMEQRMRRLEESRTRTEKTYEAIMASFFPNSNEMLTLLNDVATSTLPPLPF